jgi:ubiquinone/menaquinone biosynthesis C-methylase UbiE
VIEKASARFDLGSESYDSRKTGIPPEQGRTIAEAIVAFAGTGPDDLLLELGAGTGLVGAWFPRVGVRYLGLDASEPMLDRFRARIAEPPGTEFDVRRCDVNQPWPVADGSVACIFSSRAVHHFDRRHLADEVARVESPSGAVFVLGRVQRDPSSIRERLREEKRARVAAKGYSLGDGRQRHRKALDVFVEAGARPLDRAVAATWTMRYSAPEVLRDWTDVAGLAGAELPSSVKEEIIAELEGWARSEFGPLDDVHQSEERYVLDGVRLTGA